MRAFISEDNIEQSIVNRLSHSDLGWNRIECDPSPDKKDDVSKTGRSTPEECVLPEILRESLIRINPGIDPEKIDRIVEELRRDYSGTDIVDTNYNLYNKIRNGINVKTRIKDKEDFDIVKLIDFDNVENNTFTAVNQMWIKGHYNYRRPDVLLFVNGMPVVFIELKNSTVKMEQAYEKNLITYRKDIPNLFALNQICVLSNGLETRLGAFNAKFEFFFEWLRKNEKEKINREQIAEHGASITILLESLFRKEVLLDYIENFVFFDNKRNKIIAKNHQYYGVNNLIESAEMRKERKGKLGVFWHTQGSGKSYSMVMFVRKIKKIMKGNFTFLVVTDRENLDTQIHKTFVRTEVIGDKEECQPKNSSQLREYLSQNKSMVFTLIQKFGFDKTQKYPILSERDDIFVLVDEAHRTQYKQLAENMHTGLPNANYIAFTGTPLLGSKRLTNQWFGDYVSEYNFAQAIEDKSTVPLFYSRRVPEVGLTNNWLDSDLADIVENEDLNDREKELVENSASRILEVIKREDRLDKIARDIAHHFPRRGFLGKGMVVSVDKFTTVKMFDLVKKYWQEEIKELTKERNQADSEEKRNELTERINYMKNAEMAVVVSEEAEEEQKFIDKGLDITVHRKKMNEISPEGKDLEDRFKDSEDNLCLVFVCAMWLTGFDVPSMSTLYLDKPMKGHTLMQAIARANRVFPGKSCGVIIDYVNVFKYMKQALSDYASSGDSDEFPAKDIEQLIANLDKCIDELDGYLLSIGINIEKLLNESDVLDKLDVYADIYNKIKSNDEWKEKFKVLSNLMINLYDASKPEIFELGWHNEKFPPLQYLHGLFCNYINNEKVEKAKNEMAKVLDSSVSSAATKDNDSGYAIHQGKVIDLSKLDVDKIKERLDNTPYKALEIEDLKEFIEKVLKQMIDKNCNRVAFSQRYRNIIDRYNAGGTENQDYYEQLLKLIDDLKQEQSRSTEMNLTEEELEIYDLLMKDCKLTQAEEQRVILAAKNLYQKLTQERSKVLVVDWYKDEQPKSKVKDFIRTSLNNDLPESYDKELFDSKTNLLFNHFVDMAIQGYGWVG